MQKVFTVAVDIGRKLPAPAFDVNTNDLKSVKLLITITNGQTLLDLTDTTVRIAIRKPDNNIIFQDCTIKDAKAGQVEIVLENQAYIMAGTHTAEIMCYKGNDVVAVSGTFSYKSTKGIMNNEAVESRSEFTTITGMLKDVQDTIEDFRENGTGIDTQARADIEKATAQLAEMPKTVNGVTPNVDGDIQIPVPDIDTSNLRTKTEKINTADLSDDVLLAMTGETELNVLSIPENKSVTYEKTDFLEFELAPFKPFDIYNKSVLSDLGQYCNPSDGTFGTSQYTTNYRNTGYLPVRPNITYIRSYNYTLAFFDKDKKFISGLSSIPTKSLNGISGHGFVTPANCYYVVLNVMDANSQKEFCYMAEEDLSNPTSYRLKMPNLVVGRANNLPFSGEALVYFGDSIVEFGNYPQQVAERTGLDVINVGIGGTTIARHGNADYHNLAMYKLVDAIISKDWTLQNTANTNLGSRYTAILERLKTINFNNVEYVVLAYGTNDFSYSEVLGTKNDTTGSASFYGGINYVINRLQTAFPHLKITLVTPFFSSKIASDKGNSDDTPNYWGSYKLAYVDTMIQAAGTNHIPVYDAYRNININKNNASYYLSTDGIHPNQNGYDLLAQKVSTFLTHNF